MIVEAGYMQEKPNFWRRLGFGTAGRHQIEEREGFVESALISEAFIYFDWKDRLRILISGRVHTVTEIKTDVIVRKTYSGVSVSVLPPKSPLTPR